MYLKKALNHFAISLTMIVLLCFSIQGVIGQDSSGTWKDAETGLLWVVKDNGEDVSWNQANNYCEMLNLEGQQDWHLPTIDELKSIYDKSVSKQYKAKGPIELGAASIWSADTNRAGDVWSLNFSYGGKSLSPTGGCSGSGRALCVHRPAD